MGNEEPSKSKEGDDVGRPPVAPSTATGNLATAGWDSGPKLRAGMRRRRKLRKDRCGLGNQNDLVSHLMKDARASGVQVMAPHLIIVGGGFGGLSAARALRGAAVRVTLIDKRNYHLFRPMLYQVATGLLSADEISGPLRSILSHQENIDVLLDEVTGISPKQRIVHLKHRDLASVTI